MNKKLTSILVRARYFIFAAVYLIPIYTYAFWTWGKPLVPCGVKGVSDKTPCNITSFIELLNNLIDLAVQIAPFLAAIAFVFVGFNYVGAGGDESKIKKAHDIFSDTVFGLIVVLAAYFIIKAILIGLRVESWANLLS